MSIIFFILFFSKVNAILFYPSKKDLSNPECMVFFTTGYGQYDSLIPMEKWLKNDSSYLLEFSVSGPSNAHVSLNTNTKNSERDVQYEIVIGAGGNSYSSIRRRPKLSKTYMVDTPKIMHQSHATHFWVKIFLNKITVGRKNENAFLTYEDIYVKDMKYVSFRAWSGITLMWRFGCEDKEEKDEKPKSDYEKLIEDLLTSYDPYALPDEDSTLTVDTQIDISRIYLDAKMSSLITNSKIYMEWFDPKLQWKPENYNGLFYINLYTREIWCPDITVMNEVRSNVNNIFDYGMAKVFFNGTVVWSPKITFETRCNIDVSNWPWDRQTCDINLGLNQHPNDVHLILSQKSNTFENYHGLEWNIEKIISESVLVNTKDEVSPKNNALTIRLDLVRQRLSYVYIFVLPTIVIIAIIPSMFCLPALSATKTYFNLCSIIVLLVFLLTEENMLPALSNKTPKIIQLTSKLIFFLCLQTACVSFIKFLTTLNSTPPSWLMRVVKNRLTSFFLPNSIFNEYDYQREENEANKVVVSHWTILAMFLDRLLQIVIILIFIPIELAMTIPS